MSRLTKRLFQDDQQARFTLAMGALVTELVGAAIVLVAVFHGR